MGLLDALMGSGPEDPRSQQFGLLMQGLAQGNGVGGLLAANQFASQNAVEAPMRRMKQQLLEAQYAETMAQADERKQKMLLAQRAQARQDAFLNGDPGGVAPGAFAPAADGFGPVIPQGAAPQRGGLIEKARAIGVPENVIQSDMLFNGGKKIAEYLDKHGSPNWQNINGNLVDTNERGFTGGLQDGVSVSANGQATMWKKDGRGGLVFGAPTGAIETAGAYMDRGERSRARFDPLTIPPRAGEKNPTLTTREAFVDSQNAPPQVGNLSNESSLRGAAGGPMGADPVAIQREIKKSVYDLTNKPLDPQSRKALEDHVSGLSATLRSIQSSPVQTAQGGIPLQSEADGASLKATAEATAKDIAETRKSIMGAGFAAPTNIAKYQQLGKLLEGVDGGSLTATGTNIASAMNSLGIKIDKNLPNKEAAAALGNEMALQLRSPASGAGMPGAMSDKDREFLVGMIPNASQTAQGRKMLIDAQIAIAQRNQQVATFARNYEKKYGRLDNGFFEQMQNWSNANVMFGGK